MSQIIALTPKRYVTYVNDHCVNSNIPNVNYHGNFVHLFMLLL